MRILLGICAALLVVQSAAAESIVFVSDQVPQPGRILAVPLTGGGFQTIAVGESTPLDVSADGLHRLEASGNDLRYDGRTIVHADWPIDDARLSPDERLIAFTAESGRYCGPQSHNCATWELWVVDTNGSGSRLLTANGRYPRFAPDGTSLAYLLDYDGFLEGGYATIERLRGGRTTFGAAADAPVAWGADSRHVTYAGVSDVDPGIYVASTDPRRLARIAKRGESPVLAPSGGSVAYLDGATLKVARIGGASRVVVRAHAGEPLAWPGASILYVRVPTRLGDDLQLAAVRSDGTAATTLATFPGFPYDLRLWVRAGRAFVGVLLGRAGRTAIESVDPETGTITELTKDRGADRAPAVRFDGTLAYVRGSSTRGDRQCLFITHCLVLGREAWDVGALSWSPDGSRLALVRSYQSPAGEFTSQLSIVNADGSHPVVLTPDDGSWISSPSWSPDGRTIVFSREGRLQFNPFLWTVDVSTGIRRLLSATLHGFAPSWSPDGHSIAFHHEADSILQQREVDLLDLRTQVVTKLATTDGTAAAAWSSDSGRIAYVAQDRSLHVVDRDGTGDRMLVRDVAGTIAWAP